MYTKRYYLTIEFKDFSISKIPFPKYKESYISKSLLAPAYSNFSTFDMDGLVP